MPLTLQTADAALKEDYQPAIREQLNNTVFLLTQIERNNKDIEGRRAVLSLHVTRNSGVGARAEGGTLPAPGNQGYVEERIPLRYNYARIKVSGPAIRAMRSDRGSFVRAVDSETRGAVTDLRRDVNRQLFGTSDGVIAACGTTSSSATVQLDAATTASQMRQFEIGMKVDIGTVASPTAVVAGATIVAVNSSAKTITIDSAVTTSSSHRVFRAGSGGAGANQKELTGLQTIVAASGALFNVDPATYPVWASYVDSNGGTGRNFTETLAAKVIHEVSIRSGQDVNLFITSDGVQRNFANQLTSLKRFVNSVDLRGGYKGLEVTAGGNMGPVALVWDRDCPNGKCFALNTSHLTQYEMSDWEWMEEDGAVLSRVSGEDAYEAVLFKYHELATDQRNAHALIVDLNES
jgi:hypothetical protein